MRKLSGKTRVHVLIGAPIAQVLAPGWLTDRMQKADYDGVLVPLHVLKVDLETALPTLKAMPNIDSILITLPHKFAASKHCDRLSERARILGAINAMRREKDSTWFGDNFDGAGLTRGIMNAGKSIAGKSVFMAGAGGAGSSIAVSMLEEGARHLTFYDINASTQRMLLDKLQKSYPGNVAVGNVAPPDCDIAVNASPAGMKPGDPLPIDPSTLAPGSVAADVITDPIPTRFLIEAAKRGCITRDGSHMLDGQIDLLFDFMLGGHP